MSRILCYIVKIDGGSQPDHWTECSSDYPGAVAAVLEERLAVVEAENSELRAKLANPVMLKPAYKQSEYNRLGLEPSDAYGLAWGSNASRDDAVKQIRAAGFKVGR